jgi:glycosyltransferase involved in cell wall biosynthesis
LPGEVLDIVPYLEAAQIFVLCSNYEGLPLSVLEAMSAGLPVVSTDVGGIREAVIHGESGFLVPRGDMQRMIVRLKMLIDDPDLRLNFGKKGRRHYMENYVLKRFIDQMEQFYIQMPRKKWTQT